MGCFSPCFGTCNHRKSWKSSNPASSSDQKQAITETPLNIKPTNQDLAKINLPIKDSKDRDEEKSNVGIEMKVDFDLIEETHEELPTQEPKACSSLGYEEKERESKEQEDDEKQNSSDSSSMSSVFTYPPSHRYHKSTNNGDESEDNHEFGSQKSTKTAQEEESSESLFSLSVESRREVSVPETGEKEVNSPMTIDLSGDEKPIPVSRERSKLGLRIKNRSLAVTPIEFENQEKENKTPEREIKKPLSSEEPNLKLNRSKVGAEEEIGVETSLSSWLVGFETKPISENSPESVGNSSLGRENEPRKCRGRAILGELNVEEGEKSSASSFERSSSDCNRDENLPIVGTIGSYWSHRGKAMEPVSGSSCKPRPKDVCV